MNNISDPNG